MEFIEGVTAKETVGIQTISDGDYVGKTVRMSGAAGLEAIASYDRKDSTSIDRKGCDFTSALQDDVKGMRIGIPRDYLGDGLNPEVKSAVLNAAKVLENKGGR